MFPLHQHEFWFCEQQDCWGSDRVSGLEAQHLIHCWLQELTSDQLSKWVLRDLVRSDIALALYSVGDATLVRRLEALLISGRLHLHKKKRIVRSGSGDQEKHVPFPLAERQSREAYTPPPVIDPPSFSPNADLSTQAAVLVAAAASGTPFCQL